MNEDINCLICGETNHFLDNCPYTHGGHKHDCDNTCPVWDDDPPDAINPYAKPYDDALAGHLRLRVALGRATEATNDLGIALRDINAN